jgi:hypothetical protein
MGSRSRRNAAIRPDTAAMKLIFALAALTGLGCGLALADEVPLPRPRPPIWAEPRSFAEMAEAAGPDFKSAEMTAEPTDCDRRLAGIARLTPMPRLIGPGACGGRDMVQLDAVLLPDSSRIELKPKPLLRCEMAESLASWLRDEVAPRAGALGARLSVVDTYDDFECRGRNRVPGAILSEHGKGNAVDIRALRLGDGRLVVLTDMTIPKDFREGLRESACHRFTTVLGPGADANHESHIHLDIAERRQGYRICQWDVREPPPPPAPGTEIAAEIPLPTPRPVMPGAPINHSRKL